MCDVGLNFTRNSASCSVTSWTCQDLMTQSLFLRSLAKLTALDCFAPFVKHMPCQQTQQSSIHPQQPLDAEVVWWVCGNAEGLVRHEATACKIMQKLQIVRNSIRHFEHPTTRNSQHRTAHPTAGRLHSLET